MPASNRRRLRAALFAGLCFVLGSLRAAEGGAKIDVDGMGWWRDRELRIALTRLLDAERKETLDTNAIEDAAVILTSTLGDEGFQAPRIELEVALPGGGRERVPFDPTFAKPLPRGWRATALTLHVAPGVRSYVDAVEVTGLVAVPPARARGFFRTESVLFATRKANAWSPARGQRGADSLRTELQRLGYAEAEVAAAAAVAENGAAFVRVAVKEGPRWEVASVAYRRADDEAAPALPPAEAWVGRAWSPALQEEIREALRLAYYKAGYPDVAVRVAAAPGAPADGVRPAAVTARIESGPAVRVGAVRFSGNATTREAVLRRFVRAQAGAPFDPAALEQARYRIARLGVFQAVDLAAEPAAGPVRDAVFTVRESPRFETHLLLGYGSYEQIRAGVEHRQTNLFGRAHQARIELVQSMKSSKGEATYAVPELFGETLDGSARLFGLQREEVAFTRQEFGVDASLRRRVPALGGDLTAGYTLQALRNRENALLTRATDEEQINVASVNASLGGDTRDNPLRPRRGYHWKARVEAADPALGGEATYQRIELAGAYHTAWGAGRWVHLGFAHGTVTTLGSDDRTLPVNKRFYPGGDNSIRGYQSGEAAPRGAGGLFVGAKSYTLVNLELEQALVGQWSVVAFADALGTAVALRDLPFSERLYAAGLGVRYQTLIGPVRLEYGRNLNPRPPDPSGTWHLTIGYPF